ncbi:hypothetical protein BC830DRAFT_1169594 [Chytriomyces sp. MP71]|nr:hypothetical protein BC830DRAFT_1169594 [Chytriomyces sp. MP71]
MSQQMVNVTASPFWIVNSFSYVSNMSILYIGWAAVPACFILLIWFASLEGIFNLTSPAEWTSIATPINGMILTMIVSSCFSNLFYSLASVWKGFHASMVAITVSSLSNFTFYLAYFHYSFIRGRPVIEIICSGVLPFIPAYFATFALLELITNSAYTIIYMAVSTDPFYNAVLDWGNHTYTAATLILFLFDNFVLVCYLCYILSVQHEHVRADIARLGIICKFGVASVLVFFVGLLCNIINQYTEYNMRDPTDCYINLLLTVIDGNVNWPFLFIQLWMKRALQREKRQALDRKRREVETAKGRASPPVSNERYGVREEEVNADTFLSVVHDGH